MSLDPFPVTEVEHRCCWSIFSDRFTIGSRINALTAHAQTFLSCLKHTALDRLRVHLNVVLLIIKLKNWPSFVKDMINILVLFCAQ